MSKQLLYAFNGASNGAFKSFLDNFTGEPRIAWYPSAGTDFRALLYLHPLFRERVKSTEPEPPAPDIFLYTDYFPWEGSGFLDSNTVHVDDRTTVTAESIEELPRLRLPLHEEIVHFPEGSSATGRVLFLQLRVESKRFGTIKFPLVYAFAENEIFYCRKLVPNKAKISHVIHVRYGGGCGGGGNASGVWLKNVLGKLNSEVFITDDHHYWQNGDKKALELCPQIPREPSVQLAPIRTVNSKSWSGHGNVTWYLVK